MNQNHFLGNIDLSVVHSLLTNYSVPTRLPNGIKLNKIKQQDDLILIELGSLLDTNECDEILTNINQQKFEHMTNQYDSQNRNNWRLIVIDDRFARTLWRRLKFSNRITKLISNTKPLGFNVQGTWEMNSVNNAMRLNKYHENEYFTLHKDAQYSPSADERSLLSLIIYLNDNFEKGETKFYFPKQTPKSPVKGLTIKEEIESYGGLDYGYECMTIKPKKGHAILFTHNLLHEAIAPEINNSSEVKERIVLRTDVLVKRKEKPLGFAITSEEKDDYEACLNFFREAQQNELNIHNNKSNKSVKTTDIGELYERSLSIRYCYPRLLELKPKESIINSNEQKKLIKQLPPEIWLSIFKYLDKQDIQHLIFAFPNFQLLKIVWESQELKNFEQNLFREKFIPTIDTQYGSQTLFRFSDSKFFYKHIDQCCRVAAVYAFFLLGHTKDSTTYTVHYDRNTHEVCEVNMERILSDVFYNRNCYGSLYRVEQKDKNKREPMIDLNHSVDRAYMINRHQSQFIGQDLLSRFRFTIKSVLDLYNEKSNWDMNSDDQYYEFLKSNILGYQRKHALDDEDQALIDSCSNIINDDDSTDGEYDYNNVSGYRKNLLKQIEQGCGTSLCRILAGDSVRNPCACSDSRPSLDEVRDDIVYYNHLIFDFDTHQLTVERLSDETLHSLENHSLLYKCVEQLQRSIPQENPILFYRVNIEKLAKITKGFHHASCHCLYGDADFDQFSFLDYTYLSHVHLAISQNNDHVFVLAVYGGVAAL
ncbi:unnamed protein product [Rotaria sp. Silwood2]|nr:unnamed protein product [Rotaria sp. Silwood2]CAF4173419.1 unnamed protein product [Rotaria sp. Silwood2]